jgi:hypothetical protein
MIYLNTYNTSYGRKKGRKLKCQFDFWPLKVGNCFELCACRGRVTYRWKVFDKGYNFVLDLTSIGGLHKKLWVFKVEEVPISGISKLLTWESPEKRHLGATPMANQKKYYKGEGGGFPQVWAMVNLMSLCMFMTHLCINSVPTM